MPYICGSPVMGPDPKMGREGTSMGREVMEGSLALRAVYVVSWQALAGRRLNEWSSYSVKIRGHNV